MDERRNNLNAASDEADPSAPAAFREALQRLDGLGQVQIPPRRDDEILSRCHDQLRERLSDRKSDADSAFPAATQSGSIATDSSTQQSNADLKVLRIPFWRLRWVAAAASVVLAFATIYRARRSTQELAVNVDQPTILDAFAVARSIEEKRPTATRFDVNKDGKVDRTDVDLLAQKAVALPEGGAL